MIWHSIANLDTPKLHVCKYVYVYIFLYNHINILLLLYILICIHLFTYIYIYSILINYICVCVAFALSSYWWCPRVCPEAMDLPHCRYCTLQRNDLRRQIEGGESIGAGRRAIMESPDLRGISIVFHSFPVIQWQVNGKWMVSWLMLTIIVLDCVFWMMLGNLC